MITEEGCPGLEERALRAVAYPAAIHLTYLPGQVEEEGHLEPILDIQRPQQWISVMASVGRL
jgi:hypothetical protein